MGRQKRELALCVKPNSTETKLLAFTLECKAYEPLTSDVYPTNHPINNLTQIHDEQFSNLNALPLKTSKTILRKRRQLLQTFTKPIKVI